MKRVLLIDVDSVIPNIALGKLSTYFKERGDVVKYKSLNFPYYPYHRRRKLKLHCESFALVCVSAVFQETIKRLMVINNNVKFGGTGVDCKIKLSDKIENLDIDYSLFPNNDVSYGFITRGCIRNCSFCIVPEKEGLIRQVKDWKDIVKHKKVKFLDNNFLAFKGHKKILSDLADAKIRFNFNQGLDIRLIDEENAFLLSKCNYWREITFAFDSLKYFKEVKKGLDILERYIEKDWRLRFFVYVHPRMRLSDVIKRVLYLRNRNVLPYIMRDISCWDSELSEFYIDLAAWCNQPGIFKKTTFKEFLCRRHPNNKERIFKHLDIWRNR